MKKIITALMAAAMVLSMAGCSKKTQDDISQFVQADGRAYGQTYTAQMGEVQKNTFFSCVVNDAWTAEEINGYYFDDSIFACVNITVKNTFDEDIPMGCYDFAIQWGEAGEDEIEYATYAEDLSDDVYPEEFYLEPNESFTGTVYFPIPADAENVQFVYEEYYEDDFEGNTYLIELTSIS